MMNVPRFKEMPEPYAILTLSWEDIWYIAQTETQKRWKREPTKQEIKDIFEYISDKGMDCENGTFWTTIEVYVNNYYDDFCNVCGKEDCECDE